MIDAHAHLWLSRPEQCRKYILQAAEQFGISQVYVSTLDGDEMKPNEEIIEACNQATADFMKDYPGLIRGYVYINPQNTNAMDVMRRGMEEQGMSGVKLWVSCLCDDPSVYPLAESLIEYGKPLLIHAFYKATGQYSGESTCLHVRNLAKRYPELKIIMAHLGGEAYHGIRAIRDCENVWVDHSGTLVGSNDLAHAVRLLGTNRILFGSDMSVGGFEPSYGQMLEVAVSEKQREDMLWRNAKMLFEGGALR